MYKEKTQDWMRHLDFIALDMLCLLLGVALAYVTRYGIHLGNKDIYVSLALILLLMDFAVMIIGGTTRGVMYRGYYRELAVTVKHVLLVLMLCLMYLFLVKDTETYSRLMVGYFGCYYFVLTYVVRQLRKASLKRTPDKNKSAIYITTTSDRAPEVVDHRHLPDGRREDRYPDSGRTRYQQRGNGPALPVPGVGGRGSSVLPGALQSAWRPDGKSGGNGHRGAHGDGGLRGAGLAAAGN